MKTDSASARSSRRSASFHSLLTLVLFAIILVVINVIAFKHYYHVDLSQSQFYTLYRDMRSWTAALTFHVINNLGSPVDYGVSFQLSLKASPSTAVGQDAENPYHLVGE